MGTGARQDTFSIRLTLNGVDRGIWDKKTGGKLDSEEYKYNPGAMGPAESLGGKTTTENIVLVRLYKRDRDHDTVGTLLKAVGKGECVVNQQPLDDDGNVYGKPIIWTGTLKSVSVPDTDSESSGPALLEVEVTPAGDPAAS